MLCMHLNINATFVSKLNTSEAKYKVNHVFVRIRNIQLQAVSETEYSTAGSQSFVTTYKLPPWADFGTTQAVSKIRRSSNVS